MIIIEAYKPTWPTEFEVVRTALAEALGDLALRVDHIGSTSVPGLGAKDVIDVQVSVGALEPDIIDRLVAAGYRYRPDVTRDHVPPGEPDDLNLWSKLFFNEPDGHRMTNIHVRMVGKPNQRYALLFRDYLRAHPHASQTIELIKRQLAQYHANDVDAYYAIKDPVYDLIWRAAQSWANESEWMPS